MNHATREQSHKRSRTTGYGWGLVEDKALYSFLIVGFSGCGFALRTSRRVSLRATEDEMIAGTMTILRGGGTISKSHYGFVEHGYGVFLDRDGPLKLSHRPTPYRSIDRGWLVAEPMAQSQLAV